MVAFLTSILGANWRTSLLGVLQFVAQFAYNYIQSLTPGSTFDWKIFGMSLFLALLGFLSKDKQVTGGEVQSKDAGVLPSVTVPNPTPKP